MQKLIQRLAFAALIISGSAFASSDLLSEATNGAVTTVKAEATTLSQNEMKEVKGGTIYVSMSARGSSYNPLRNIPSVTKVKGW